MIRTMLLALVALSGCGAPSIDEELRALISEAETAVESRNTSFFRGVIGDSYLDSRGNDRDRLIDAIRAFFLTNSQIEAIVRVQEVRVDGPDSARIVLQVALLRETDGAPLFGFDADLRTLELEALRNGAWEIIGAEWE
jgi:hypothetical protein